ncbi:MAG: methyltransferase [Candidatus Moraniibacteriota bacterium]|nr:MAG: methyltransferase [Candidatus Moranbacteria bacterium]
MSKIKPQLGNVPETLLIPLRARSNETKLENGIISDPKSVEIVQKIESNTKEKGEVSMSSQKGVAVRTEILDELTQKFLKKNPDGTVVNLGCGLDTRYYRLHNNQVRWFDLDVPEAIALRKNFFTPTEKYQFISKSVLDFSWNDVIPQDKPILFIAEGLLMYFTEAEVQSIFTNIAKQFPGSEMIFEAMSPFVAKNSSKHADVKKYDAEFKWGIKSGTEIENWNIGVRFITEYFYNRHLDKMPFVMRFMFTLPFFKKAMKIVHVKFK